MCRVFERIAGSDLRSNFQSWLFVDPGDAGADAVYLHTPNPNADNYPFNVGEYAEDTGDVSEFFKELLPSFHTRVLLPVYSSAARPFLVCANGVGLPIADRP